MTITALVTIEPIECGACGVVFGLSDEFLKRRRADHKTFCCPNGHQRYFPQKSDLEKARDELAREKHRAEQAEARANDHFSARLHVERRLSATKGQLTKIKKRVQNGVCPHCSRTFRQLAAHIRTKHPGCIAEHAETAS